MTEGQLNILEEDAWLDSPLNDSYRQAFKEGFNESIKRLLSQPLSDRLTDKEKDEITDVYSSLSKKTRNFDLPIDMRQCALAQMNILETLFGVTLFEE